jgi:hypothetical protein
MSRFRLSKAEYNEIKEGMRAGRISSVSPAIGRELSKVREVGIDGYDWRQKNNV